MAPKIPFLKCHAQHWQDACPGGPRPGPSLSHWDPQTLPAPLFPGQCRTEMTETQEQVWWLKMLRQTDTHRASTSPRMGRPVPVSRGQALGWSSSDLSQRLDKQTRAFAAGRSAGSPDTVAACEWYRAGPHSWSRVALLGREEPSAPAHPSCLAPAALGREGTAGTELKAAGPGTVRLPEDRACSKMLGCPRVPLGMGTRSRLLLASQSPASPACGPSQHSHDVACHLPAGKRLGISKRVMPWKYPTPHPRGESRAPRSPHKPYTHCLPCSTQAQPIPGTGAGGCHRPSVWGLTRTIRLMSGEAHHQSPLPDSQLH